MASSLNGSHSLKDVIDQVYNTVRDAKDFNLEYEVLATAFIYLKENPDATIQEALNVGRNDWDV
jgi:hypothetical protein